MLLNATLPKIFQRKVLRWLPPELGQYVLDAGRPFSLAGEIALASRRFHSDANLSGVALCAYRMVACNDAAYACGFIELQATEAYLTCCSMPTSAVDATLVVSCSTKCRT